MDFESLFCRREKLAGGGEISGRILGPVACLLGRIGKNVLSERCNILHMTSIFDPFKIWNKLEGIHTKHGIRKIVFFLFVFLT